MTKRIVLFFILFFSLAGSQSIQVYAAAKPKLATKKPIKPKKKKVTAPKTVTKRAPTKLSKRRVIKKKQHISVKKKIIATPKRKPRTKIDPAKSKKLIVIDPGHGDFDFGARVKECVEKELALLTALFTKQYLNDKGYRVTMTRYNDHFVSLEDRSKMANKSKAAIFVSLHYNASKNKQAHGIEVYYHGDKKTTSKVTHSKDLADHIINKAVLWTKAKSRGVKSAGFHVIKETTMPSILIEGGFITNDFERRNLKNTKYIERLSRGIAAGIDTYLQSID